MKFVIFCLAASLLAAVHAGIDPRMQPSKQRQKRNSDLDRFFREIPSDGKNTPVGVIIPNIYVPQAATPTTTSNPMCPVPGGPCRELALGQKGSIKVLNVGIYSLQILVEFKSGYRKDTKDSDLFGLGQTRIVEIPPEAEDITVTLKAFGLFGINSDILKKQYPYPVIRCYYSGDGRTVAKTGC
ncbi:hypothetical protein V9T40_003193 [Parthenolecanium corni]|uniref:Uncharacterized protein n=1 Tax=Parthenolecanium corni TaxID=536013 RepID=A0AAN9U0T8_9HEMI